MCQVAVVSSCSGCVEWWVVYESAESEDAFTVAEHVRRWRQGFARTLSKCICSSELAVYARVRPKPGLALPQPCKFRPVRLVVRPQFIASPVV